ncbi:type II secretion system protein N [Desulfobacula sp.]
MKYAFTIINMVLIATAAYFCVDMMYKNIVPENFMLSEKHFSGEKSRNISQHNGEPRFEKNQYEIIVKRNLFKVEIEEKKSSDKKSTKSKEPEKLEITGLKLILWGTVTGGNNVYAVIENKKLSQQDLYEVGDSIQGAKIKQISRHEIILSYQGKDQVLEMETDNKNISTPKMPMEWGNINKMTDDKIFKNISSDNIDVLIKQIKIRPHFSEGEPDGLMVYGIKPNSILKQLGIKNGDIIKDINGMETLSSEDVSSFYNEIKLTENTKITLLRQGKIIELTQPVKNDPYLITTFPEDIMRAKGDE